MNTTIRLGASAVAGLGAGIVVAVMVAIADLYLTGHGDGSIRREVVSWDSGGVHLSIGDVILLVTVMVVVAATWRFTGRSFRRTEPTVPDVADGPVD